MHMQTKKTTVTFARAFQLEGHEAVLPAGVYSLESENDVLDGMLLPECLRTSVLIHLQSMPGSPGYSQTMTVSWDVLEAALLRDRSPAVAIPTEPSREEMLLDSAIRLLIRSDGVSEAFVRDLVLHLPERTFSHLKSE